MTVLREKVQCYRCCQEIGKLEARKLPLITAEPRYECFACFKRYPQLQWGKSANLKTKAELYCQHCNYKFASKKLICPYCNRQDGVIKGKISINDLL